jgi:hypothetical protein
VSDDATDSAAVAANSTYTQQQTSSSTANQQQSTVTSLYSEATEAPSIDILLNQKPHYGFNNAFSGFFSGLREELIDMVQLPTPDTVSVTRNFTQIIIMYTYKLLIGIVLSAAVR